jgi:hypothetical protein
MDFQEKYIKYLNKNGGGSARDEQIENDAVIARDLQRQYNKAVIAEDRPRKYNRREHKGKSKGKGKNKHGSKNVDKDKGKGKGKDKGKGKGKDKGKGKGKGKDKGKGNRYGGTGLINNKNLCYMHSVIQLLYKIPSIRDMEVATDDDESMHYYLNQVFKKMDRNKGSKINLLEERAKNGNVLATGLISFFQDKKNRKSGRQNPANEFLNLVLGSFDYQKTKNITYIENNDRICYVDVDGMTRTRTRDVREVEHGQLLELVLNGSSIQECIDRNTPSIKQNYDILDDCIGANPNEYNDTYTISNINIPNDLTHLLISLGRDNGVNKFDNRPIINNKHIIINNINFELSGTIIYRYGGHTSGGESTGHYYYIHYNDDNTITEYNDSVIQLYTKDEKYINTHNKICVYRKIEKEKESAKAKAKVKVKAKAKAKAKVEVKAKAKAKAGTKARTRGSTSDHGSSDRSTT